MKYEEWKREQGLRGHSGIVDAVVEDVDLVVGDGETIPGRQDIRINWETDEVVVGMFYPADGDEEFDPGEDFLVECIEWDDVLIAL